MSSRGASIGRYLIPLVLAAASTAAGVWGNATPRQIVGGLALLALAGYAVEAIADPSRRTGHLVTLIAVLCGVILVLEVAGTDPPAPPAEARPVSDLRPEPRVAFTKPREGDTVTRTERDIRGTAEHLPAGAVIWLAVAGASVDATPGWYPASVPCRMLAPPSTTWVCNSDSVYFGDAPVSDRPYRLAAIIADGYEQAAIITYHLRNHGLTDPPPWTPDPGSLRIGHEIQVQRAGA